MATAYHQREQLRRRPPWVDPSLAFFCGVCNEWHWRTAGREVCPHQPPWHPVSDD